MSTTSTPVSYAAPPVAPRRGQQRLVWLAPLIAGVVFAGVFATMIGWPATLTDAFVRIAYSALGAALVGIVIDVARWRRWVLFVLNAIAVAVCVWPTMEPMTTTGAAAWTTAHFALVVTTVSLIVAAVTCAAQVLRERDGTPLSGLVLLGMTAAGGGLIAMTGTLRLGEMSAPLVAAVLAVLIMSIFVRPLRASDGLLTFGLATLAGMLTSGRLWSELPLLYAAAAFVAPLIAWVVRVPWVARMRPWKRVLIGLLLAALPAALASAVAGRAAFKSMEPKSAEENYYGV